MDPDDPQVNESSTPPEALTAPIDAPDEDAAPAAPAVTPPSQSTSLDIPAEPPEEAPLSAPVAPSNFEVANDPSVPQAPVAPVVPVAPVEPIVPIDQPAPFDPHSKDELNFLRTVLAPRAWASHRARTQAKLDKIMALAREKGQIDRSDVRDLLNRSKPACTRYLTTLVKRGLLTRHRVLDDTVYRVVG